MQNQMRTNEIRIDLLRRQNDSLKSSLEKLLSINNSSQSLVTGERYEELRSQSRQEPPDRRYSYGNETVTPVLRINNSMENCTGIGIFAAVRLKYILLN